MNMNSESEELGTGVSHIAEARRTAMTSIEDWDYLSDEEKYGTLHEVVDQLAKAEGDS